MPENKLIQSYLAGWQRVRQLTEKLIDGAFTPEQLVYQIPGCSSHILWLTGHIAAPYELLVNRMLFGKGALPDNYGELFGMGTAPSADASVYPAFSEVREQLRLATQLARANVETMSDADLANDIPDERLRQFFGNVGGIISLMPGHESYHIGQIALLRKTQGI